MNEETRPLIDLDESDLREIRQQIEAWKDEYQSIYITEFENGDAFIWRELSRAEFRKASEYYEDVYERADYVCRLCVLDPVLSELDFNAFSHAGIPEVLTENILRESGFAGSYKIEELEAKYEEEMVAFDNQVGCIIVEAFPQHTLEEVEHWSLEKTMYYYSRAKWVLMVLRGVPLERETIEAPPSGPIIQGSPEDFPELRRMKK